MSGILGTIFAAIKSVPRLTNWSTGRAGSGTLNLVYNSGTYVDFAIGGGYYGFGSSSGGLPTTTAAYTSSGTLWSSVTLPASYEWGASATNGTTLVAFPSGATVTGPAVAYRTSGSSWTTASLPYTGTPYRVFHTIWDGTRFLSITSATGNEGLLHSTTGTSWSGIDIGNGGLTIGFDGASRYIVTANASSATYQTCTSNPTVVGNWSTGTLPAAALWTSVVYGNGIWVAFCLNSTSYATSTNGTTWTSRTLPAAFSNSIATLWNKGVFAFGRFYFGNGLNIYSSEDGINWVTDYTSATDTPTNYTAWLTGPDRMFAMGTDTTSAGEDNYVVGSI